MSRLLTERNKGLLIESPSEFLERGLLLEVTRSS